MGDRMAALVFANRFVGGKTQALVAVFCIPAGIGRRTVIGVNDVARRAAAAAIIARMIVRAHEIQQRIVQSRFLQIQKHRIGAEQCAESAIAQTARGLAGFFKRIWISKLQLFLAAALKDAEQIARLADVEARQRIKERQNAMLLRHLRRDRHGTFQTQRLAVRRVSLAEAVVFRGIRAVVVERRAPKHRTVTHHAVANIIYNFSMTRRAGFFRNA